MNELINIIQAEIGDEKQQAVNARELWKFLGSKRQFANWIKKRIDEYGFKEGEDFLTNLLKSHGRPTNEYTISIDMAKELAMVENNDQGRKARQYFIAVEKEYRKQSAKAALPDSATLIATLYSEMEQRIKAEQQRDEYRRNLERLAYASRLNFGEISESTGLPKDIIVAMHCKSMAKPHAPQTQRYIQLALPLETLVIDAAKAMIEVR